MRYTKALMGHDTNTGTRMRYGQLGVGVLVVLVACGIGTALYVRGSVRRVADGSSAPAVLAARTQNLPVTMAVTATASKPLGDGSSRTRFTATVELTNTMSTPALIAPGMQFTLFGADGVAVTPTAEFVEAGVVAGGPLVPQQRMPLHLDFVVGSSFMPSRLVFVLDAAHAPAVAGVWSSQ